MRTITQPTPIPDTRRAPRVTRSTAALIAQYIQDLATPAAPAACPG